MISGQVDLGIGIAALAALCGAVNTCRRVLRTSNGEVRSEATVPERAPEMKVVERPASMC
jgi:hypothetical protein